MASGAADGEEDRMKDIIRSLRGITFTPSPAYGLDAPFNLSTVYNASTALGRASFANQLRQSALRAEMPNTSLEYIKRHSRAGIPEEERRALENSVFGQATVRLSNSARATRKGNRTRTVSQRFNMPPPPPDTPQPWAPPASKRPRLNEVQPEPESEPEIVFTGNNSPTAAAVAPTPLVLPPKTKRYLREGNYVVATATAPRNGVLGNYIIRKPGVIKRVTYTMLPNGMVKRYAVQPLENINTTRKSISIYKEKQITHAPSQFTKKRNNEERADFINRIYSANLPAIYPYYNPYYIIVSGPSGDLYELSRLLPRGLRAPHTEAEVDALPPGDEKTLLKFMYAWSNLVESVGGVYRDFLRKIYKIHSATDRSPSSFSILIRDSALIPNSSPAFIYGIRELLTRPQFFLDKCTAHVVDGQGVYDCRGYTEEFIQTILNNGIYIPQRDPRSARYSIKDRIEFYLKLILYHPFTQHLNPWLSYIDSIAVVVKNPSLINTHIDKYTYKVSPVKKLIEPNKKVLDHAFREAMRLALEYV